MFLVKSWLEVVDSRELSNAREQSSPVYQSPATFDMSCRGSTFPKNVVSMSWRHFVHDMSSNYSSKGQRYVAAILT